MHIHNVYFWFVDGLGTEEKKAFEKGLDELLHIPLIRSGHWGVPAGVDRDVVDGSFAYSLTLFFDTREKHDQYQTDADHYRFIAAFKHLWARVQVYDTRTGG